MSTRVTESVVEQAVFAWSKASAGEFFTVPTSRRAKWSLRQLYEGAVLHSVRGIGECDRNA